jgi:hypothetical protein
MKKTAFLLLSTTTVYRGCRILVPETIKNLHAPKCHTCKHFISGDLDHFLFTSNSHRFAKCKKFGDANLVSGKINHDYADSCRSTESKCGQNGTRYEFDEFHKAKSDLLLLKPFLSWAVIFSPITLVALASYFSKHN